MLILVVYSLVTPNRTMSPLSQTLSLSILIPTPTVRGRSLPSRSSSQINICAAHSHQYNTPLTPILYYS